MDPISLATEFARGAMILALELAFPMLAVGLIVGLIVSVLQAVTQVQDQTISFIPKIIAMATTLFILLPWLLGVTTNYARDVLSRINSSWMP